MEKDNIILIDGKTYLKAKASIIPTSRSNDRRDVHQIYQHSETEEFIIGYMNARSTKEVPCCVYITSDEKIFEDDNVLLDDNNIVKAINFIGHIGFKEIDGTEFRYFTPTDRKIISTTNNEVGYGDNVGAFYHLSSPSEQFIGKLLSVNKKPINIDVVVELIGGGTEEVLTPTCCDEVIITYKNIPYKLKLDSDNHPNIHLLKNKWSTEELEQMLISAISECNATDGNLIGADPCEAAIWVKNAIIQIDK